MADKKSINVGEQILLSCIPWISLFAFYRIEKLIKGIVIYLIILFGSIGLQIAFPFPYGLIFGITIFIVSPIYFVRKWTQDWNDELLKQESKLNAYQDSTKKTELDSKPKDPNYYHDG